jgi:hypothetical protein
MKDGGSRDRRGSYRHLACAPAHIHKKEGKPRLSLIRDLSITGAMILTRTKLQIGDRLALTLYVEGPDIPYEVQGSVVRFERREDGVLWPYTVAVQFDRALDDIEDQVKALAEHQAQLARRAPR